jgi:lysocardiolipin and lysophospholipid acyltransferase
MKSFIVKSHEYAKEHELPVMDHCLLPRFKGFIATVIGLRGSDVHVLYDITVVYYHRRRGANHFPSFFEVFTGKQDGYAAHVHVDRVPFTKLPESEEALKSWIFERFQYKNILISEIKTIFDRIYKP